MRRVRTEQNHDSLHGESVNFPCSISFNVHIHINYAYIFVCTSHRSYHAHHCSESSGTSFCFIIQLRQEDNLEFAGFAYRVQQQLIHAVSSNSSGSLSSRSRSIGFSPSRVQQQWLLAVRARSSRFTPPRPTAVAACRPDPEAASCVQQQWFLAVPRQEQ